jgi:hypothetical protein
VPSIKEIIGAMLWPLNYKSQRHLEINCLDMKQNIFKVSMITGLSLILSSSFIHFKHSVINTNYQAWYACSFQAVPPISNVMGHSARTGTVLHESESPFDVEPYGDCYANDDNICVVEIKYINGSPAAGNLIDFKTGETPF